MTWPLATVIVAGIAGLVALVHTVLPYIAARGEEQRKADALKAVNARIDKVESDLAGRRLPISLPGRRSA